MAKKVMKPELWTPRPVAETLQVYTEWADRYDVDVKDRGYVTPGRIADALLPFVEPGTTLLDYGCGTGLSGKALAEVGLGPLHGTDITAAMVDVAKTKRIYQKLWVGEPGQAPCAPADYGVIVATGVVSLGAAPPECFDLLLDSLAPGGLLAMSFNDPTLQDGRYDAQLETRSADFITEFRAHGPHLKEAEMGADVMVLRRV
ncbi:MAG: methyltransferase domain-containing protein [Pseudomonadota bacterium]